MVPLDPNLHTKLRICNWVTWRAGVWGKFMRRLELISVYIYYVNIFNIWQRFSAIDDQKILQRTVFITANTQTLNALIMQLHNRKYLQHVGFFLLFLNKWKFLSELKSSSPFAINCYKWNVKFNLRSWRWKFTSFVPNSAVSSSVLNKLGFIYMSIFSIRHWNVIQKLNYATLSQEFVICLMMIPHWLLLEPLQAVCILMLSSYHKSAFKPGNNHHK